MERSEGPNPPGQRRTVDTTRTAIAMTAALLVFGTIAQVASAPSQTRPRTVGGLSVLGAHEHLVSFEDFSFGANGWNGVPSPTGVGDTARLPGPPDRGTLSKRFVLPAGTRRVEVSFDLHLHGDRQGSLPNVSLNGVPVLSADPTAQQQGTRMMLRRHDTGDGGTRLSAWIALDAPGEALNLTLQAPHANPAPWAIDNLSVVASPVS